jgi:putative membrane protein
MSTDHDTAVHRPPRLPSDLGALRTVLSADRTLMSWIRTALSMLSFGFTIYKFLEAIAQQTPLAHPRSPQQVGLFLAALGTGSMVVGTFSYWVTLRDLQKTERFRLGRPILLIALVISLAGVTLFVTMASRLI